MAKNKSAELDYETGKSFTKVLLKDKSFAKVFPVDKQ